MCDAADSLLFRGHRELLCLMPVYFPGCSGKFGYWRQPAASHKCYYPCVRLEAPCFQFSRALDKRYVRLKDIGYFAVVSIAELEGDASITHPNPKSQPLILNPQVQLQALNSLVWQIQIRRKSPHGRRALVFSRGY